MALRASELVEHDQALVPSWLVLEEIEEALEEIGIVLPEKIATGTSGAPLHDAREGSAAKSCEQLDDVADECELCLGQGGLFIGSGAASIVKAASREGSTFVRLERRTCVGSRKVFLFRSFVALSSLLPSEYQRPKASSSASWIEQTRFQRSASATATPAKTS